MTRRAPGYGRFRSAAVAVSAAILGALLAVTAIAPAQAETTTTANPWTYQMTDPTKDGLVIRGTTGSNNPFIVYDPYVQPIVAVGEYGGFKVFGDCSAVNRGDDVYHSQVTLCADEPVASVCVRNGQLWIGGAGGHVWRCADLDGPGGPSPFAWWMAL